MQLHIQCHAQPHTKQIRPISVRVGVMFFTHGSDVVNKTFALRIPTTLLMLCPPKGCQIASVCEPDEPRLLQELPTSLITSPSLPQKDWSSSFNNKNSSSVRNLPEPSPLEHAHVRETYMTFSRRKKKNVVVSCLQYNQNKTTKKTHYLIRTGGMSHTPSHEESRS